MKSNLITIWIFLSLCFMFSCKRQTQECATFGVAKPPRILFISIKHKNLPLPDTTLNALKLFYLKENKKVYVNDFQRLTAPEYISYGILATQDVGLLSADNNIKNYYLEFSNGNINTLYVDYKHYSACEADTSSCKCIYPLQKVMFNNQIVTYDYNLSSTIQHEVFILIK